jgi:acetylglutamate kinase
MSRTGERAEELQAKAAVLHEALPWIKRFAGRTVVVKYGGAAMSSPAHDSNGESPRNPENPESPESPEPGGSGGLSSEARTQAPGGEAEPSVSPPVDNLADLDSFVGDVVLLRYVGVDVVVVHGGGPEISRAMEELGRQPVFVEGQRVTDADTIDLVRMILVGRINKGIVGRLNRHGRLAVGLSGEDGLLITARPRRDPGGRDLGFVGDVEAIDATALRALTAAGLIPVIATVAAGPGGHPYNVNADAAAGAVAAALGAEKLVYLTDVEGLYADPADPGSLYSRIGLREVEELLASGRLHSGMVPKVNGVATALRAGVGSAHILDGRRRHALLLELFTDRGVGTMATAAAATAEPGGRSESAAAATAEPGGRSESAAAEGGTPPSLRRSPKD